MKVLLILILIEFDKSNLILQSNIQISDWGKEFQPANPIEFLNSISVKSLIHCAKFCNLNIHCRTFDYDVSTLICRLIEGEVNTGLIIPSISLTSRVGFLRYSSSNYLIYNQSCSQCEQNRYLICLNETCRCPLHSFWNEIQCENQKYSGQLCYQKDSCRNDLFGLQCSFQNICSNNTNPPFIIEWSLKENLNDTYGYYNGILMNENLQWIFPDYTGYHKAAYFTNKTYIIIPYSLNLIDRSFTLSTWIKLSLNIPLNSSEFGLFTHCENEILGKCFYISIRNGKLFASLSNKNLIGNTNLISNLWYHISYIYDRISLKQSFYLNGKIDGILFPSEIFQSNANQILIGVSPNTINTLNLFAQMNQMIFVSYIKNTSEIIDEATLVVYYRFDNSLIDSSSYQNQNSSGINIQFDLNGRFNQALLLNSTYSLFQVTGFYFLGQINYPFTFSIWIYPFTNQGIIIEVRGFDNFWWTPMLGFDSNHYLKAQTWNGGAFYYVTLNSFVLPLNTWTHVTTTFSVDNGLRLFVNGTLVNQTSSYYVHIASGTFNILSIGGCSDPIRWGNSTHSTILPIQYRGKIDEMKIYSRELTIDEVYTLAN